MNPNNHENHAPIYGNNGGFMDLMKTQLMTFTMMKSMNNQNNNTNNSDSGFAHIFYIFLTTALIEFLLKTVFPTGFMMAKEYYKNNVKHSHLLKDLHLSENADKKTSSITIHVNVSDLENRYGQALLDYITNNNNTKHIRYKKQNFILNQTDVIEICENIFICLKENEELDGPVTTTTTNPTANTGGAQILQTIELFSYTKTTHELRQFLNKISYDYDIKQKNKLGDDTFYFNQHPMNAPRMTNGEKDYSKLPNTCTFTMKKFQTNRRFSNLFGPEIDTVRKRVNFFIKNKKWYDAKGIPYTLGLLLSGQAGAGKTSTIKCLGNETGRHIININLNNDITKTQMENLFYNEVISVINNSTGQTEKYSIPLDQRIYVLEDIDCQSDLVMDRDYRNMGDLVMDRDYRNNKSNGDLVMDRDTKKNGKEINSKSNQANPVGKKECNLPQYQSNSELFPGAEKIDLSFLLNLLDGVLEIPGRIVIMTSNYIKMLDKALIRPGRIDVIANFKKCTNQTLLEMMEFFYERKLDNDCVDRIFVLEEYIISPAEMSKLMFENMEDYEKVIEFLETKSRQYQMEEMKEMEEMEKIEKIEIEKIEKIEIEEMEKMEIEEMEKIEMEKMEKMEMEKMEMEKIEHQEVENNFHLLSSTLHDDTMGYAMQSSIGFSHFR
jgi:hypothetical protein